MDWDDLRFVLAANRARTLTGAAVDLGVTHSTVGRRIRGLEAHLGVRVFDRTPDGLIATVEGIDLVHLAEQMETAILVTKGRVMGRDADLNGQLRVTTFDFGFSGFHDAFATFMTRYPSIQLTITASLDPVSLARREADVAIRLAESPPEMLIGRRVGRVRFAVYANQELVDRIGQDAPLSAYPWLAWDERLDGRWIEEWLAHNAPGAQIALRIDESTILRQQAVRASLGVFFMPCFVGDADPMLRRLGPVPFTQSLWLLTLPDLRHTARVRAFMDHMADALVGHRVTTAGSAL